MIPTLDQALRLIGRSLMPPHILVHSVMVRRVALVLGASLVRSGHALDLPWWRWRPCSTTSPRWSVSAGQGTTRSWARSS